jgi:hypothetical protein
MSSKYFSLEYTGTYPNLQSFLTTRGWSAEVKNLGGNKLFLKLSEDSVEELRYCIDMESDELKGGKIIRIKDIQESEFQNFSENGFEIIHDHHHENKLADQKLIKNVELPKQVNQIEYPKFNQEEPQIDSEQVSKEEISERIARALTDTILPSKSPLRPDDPFFYLTSPRYLKSFFFLSTLIIFVLALLD